MKYLKTHMKRLFTALAFSSLIVCISCGPEEVPKTEVNEFEEQAKKLVATWNLNDDGAVLGSAQSEWNDLTLTLTGDENGGSFTTNVTSLSLADNATVVWPASGTWDFTGEDGTGDAEIGSLLRNGDKVVIAVTVSDTQLVTTFTIDTSSGRVFGVDGDWAFTFTKQ